jgi:hypothetical protein
MGRVAAARCSAERPERLGLFAELCGLTYVMTASGRNGQVVGEREIAADDGGHRQALQWARQLDPDVVWALEDCRHVSHHLERALVTSGERVVRVPLKVDGAVPPWRARGRQVRSDRRAVSRRLRSMEPSARVGITKEHVRRIRELSREATRLKRELHTLVAAHTLPTYSPRRGAAQSPPRSSSARPLGRSDSPPTRTSPGWPASLRFRCPAAGLIATAYTAAATVASTALHVIAITRGRWEPATRAYLQRKETEGKNRMEALRCLKRLLARHFHTSSYSHQQPWPALLQGSSRACGHVDNPWVVQALSMSTGDPAHQTKSWHRARLARLVD